MSEQNETATETQTEAPATTGGSVEKTEFFLTLQGTRATTGFHISPTGIEILPDITLEEWKNGLKLFKWAQSKIKLDFAKYISFGELKFGKEAVDNSLAQLEFDLPNVSQAATINAIPEDVRQEGLSAEHYIVLGRADLKKPQIAKWAKIAAEQHLTPSQLKVSIANGEVVNPSVARQQTSGILSIHGTRAEFDIWLRRVGGVEGILKQDIENIREVIGELKAFADTHEALVKGLQALLQNRKTKPKQKKKKKHANTK